MTVPSAPLLGGGYAVTATDGINTATQDGSANTAKFTVTSTFSVSPTSSAPGGNGVATGTGFAASSPITIQLNGTTVSSGCNSGTNGSFNCSFTLPVTTTGAATVTANDGSGPITLSGSFTVLSGATPGGQTAMVIKKISPNFGPSTGGTKKNPSPAPPTSTTVTNAITIVGSGFGNATQVFFGSAAGALVSINPAGSAIKVIPPAGSGAVQVTVAGANGNSDATTATSLYFYGPQVKAVSPNFGPAVGGNAVSIKGHNLTGATTANFIAASGQSSTPSSTSVTPCSTTSADSCVKMTLPSGVASGGGAYFVEVGGGTGGSSDILSQISLFTGELYSFGPVVASISPTFGPATGGNTLTIKGHGFTGATAVKVGSTTIGSGLTITGDTTITVTLPAQAGADPAQVNVVVVGQNGDVSPNVPKDLYSYGPLVLAVSPKSGATGSLTKVTITGKNFLNASQVVFGTISVSSSGFTVNSTGTGITLTSVPSLPSGQNPGARYITVVGANGPSDVSAINPKAVFNIL